jgi:hypothetical protein
MPVFLRKPCHAEAHGDEEHRPAKALGWLTTVHGPLCANTGAVDR